MSFVLLALQSIRTQPAKTKAEERRAKILIKKKKKKKFKRLDVYVDDYPVVRRR